MGGIEMGSDDFQIRGMSRVMFGTGAKVWLRVWQEVESAFGEEAERFAWLVV